MSENDADGQLFDPAQDDAPAEKTFTQAQLDKIISNRLPEFESYKAKAAQLDALTETAQTAEERQAEWQARVEQAETELAWRDTLLLRQELAAKAGVDPGWWGRIRGETPEEIEADIQELLTGGGPSGRQSTRRPTPLRSGASGDQKLDKKELAAQAFRGAREAR
jgi:hypothetical protein